MTQQQKIRLIGISGRIGSGKDTIGKMIQEFTKPSWEIQKFAEELKIWAARALGIPRSDLEKEEVKKAYLGEEWSYIRQERFVEAGEVSIRPVKYYLTYRGFMLKLGTDVARSIHSNFWVNILFSRWKKVLPSAEALVAAGIIKGPVTGSVTLDLADIPDHMFVLPCWVITDVRFNNEAMSIKERGGLLLRVERGERKVDAHVSETELDDFPYFDGMIRNDGTIEELREAVKTWLTKYDIADLHTGK